MKAIILAAGRGSRLLAFTEDKPKCLNKVGGKTILESQITLFNECGISDITVVTGYKSEMIEALGVKTIKNHRWDQTNMVVSLLSAKELFDDRVIVSYGDIVYGRNVLRPLIGAKEDAVVVYDMEWKKLWEERFLNPLDDAESFRIDENGWIKDIGLKVSNIDDIQGQYIGLMNFSPKALELIVSSTSLIPENIINKMDMTSLLRNMINSGYPVYGMPIKSGWCEIDTPFDLSLADELYAAGHFG